MGLDDPWRRLVDLVQNALFTRHPYRRPIIGYVDALRSLPPEGMRDYYRRFYHPGNATLVICGDVETVLIVRTVWVPAAANVFTPSTRGRSDSTRVPLSSCHV